jgi:hypothetical protein
MILTIPVCSLLGLVLTVFHDLTPPKISLSFTQQELECSSKCIPNFPKAKENEHKER